MGYILCMTFEPGVTLADLEKLRGALAAETLVEKTRIPAPDWAIDGGVLHNARVPFFHVAGYVGDDAAEYLLIVQKETAVVGLLTASINGVRHFLLNARSEPGLHGLCQFSTTIQSTPSNYLRKHGGSATPHIELFVDPGSSATVLHESLQYDWGQYYAAKRKRFVILETSDVIPVSEPLVWVAEPTLCDLLRMDFSATTDLRCALAILRAERGQPREAVVVDYEPVSAARQVRLSELSNWVIDDYGIRERTPHQRVSVEYVRASSPSREVREWGQPLVRVDEPDRVRLWTRSSEIGREFAVARHSQIGLDGLSLYFPALLDGEGVVEQRVMTSAEGGRFLRHQVNVELVTAPPNVTLAEGAQWISQEALARLIVTDTATSVELRLATSLVTGAWGID